MRNLERGSRRHTVSHPRSGSAKGSATTAALQISHQSSPYRESSEIGIRERQCAQGPAMHVSSPEFVVSKSGRHHADLRKPSPWTYAPTGTYCASFDLSALRPYFARSMPIVASLARSEERRVGKECATL